MNTPNISVRVAGIPIVAASLSVVGVVLIGMWTQGQASIWLALLGLFVVSKSLSAARDLKRYKAWRTEWDSVGTFGKQPVQAPGRLLPALTVLASALFFGIIAYWPQIKDMTQLPDLQVWSEWIWCLCAIFLFARLCVGIRALARKRGAKVVKTTEDAPLVSWMLSATVDSPSREMAVRSLPEYAARVLSPESVAQKNISH